ncbi:universal stress protein [Natrinema salaciae]|uniref:Nucleotide-binding universal stress protein, UspA family n=1 Tax=Natrinema salaciae TaxID=1186196 RepID=A0A1H9EE08_9EURY|nr:universal stress protein [Natrinema salaciae]SEQ23950.1 Nucleotide-binding universal stress protein, UspA family [Natrinema salaciae]
MASKSLGSMESTMLEDRETSATVSDPGSFDRILVAIDGDTDDDVSAAAVSLAARHGARVDALSVVRMNASVDHWDLRVERREASAEAALDAVGDAADQTDVAVAKRLRYGDPAEQIELYAEHNDVDLIVVGEPTRTGIRRYLSPTSVTERVHRSASVPVLTVPADDD